MTERISKEERASRRLSNLNCSQGGQHKVNNGQCCKCGEAVRKNARKSKCFHVFVGKLPERHCEKCGLQQPVGEPFKGKHNARLKANGNRKHYLKKLIATQGNICRYCGVTLLPEDTIGEDRSRARTIDHLIPVAQGGKKVLENFVLACHWCNQEKADRPESDLLSSETFARRAIWARRINAIESCENPNISAMS